MHQEQTDVQMYSMQPDPFHGLGLVLLDYSNTCLALLVHESTKHFQIILCWEKSYLNTTLSE